MNNDRDNRSNPCPQQPSQPIQVLQNEGFEKKGGFERQSSELPQAPVPPPPEDN